MEIFEIEFNKESIKMKNDILIHLPNYKILVEYDTMENIFKDFDELDIKIIKKIDKLEDKEEIIYNG